ncbi:alpha/beta hydrolase [Phytohabitans flavus]|uniref:Alpha/beta hydrolase n=1 Tax=Phytohabitans flavus TaxID=1076124 RepID=A0A6F8XVN8_9ACTN|nr:alpha/beta hydrolase [Phytohabitans flavus]BCB77801.1 alpha/beta hydrolase [Phytohabitans flavus]
MTENARAAAVSADGTVIAFDAWGEGEPLVIIDGATAYPAINPINAELGGLLDGAFRTYAYDRRGRGDSTDTAPYAIEREIEDIAALIEVAGAPATVFGWSSGAVLALDAAAAGLKIKRLVLFEPPFVVDDSRPPLPADYVERLDAAVAAGRPGDAAAIFMTDAAGAAPEDLAGIRESEFWPVLEAVAPTIAYDGRIMGTTMSGNPLPRDRWAAVTVPTLVMHGTNTFPAMIPAARALAELLPTATLRQVEGEQHSAPPAVLAAELRAFAR